MTFPSGYVWHVYCCPRQGLLSWARGKIGEACLVEAAEEIERLHEKLEAASGKDYRQVMVHAVKFLFTEKAPVKCDKNFLSAVAHIEKKVEQWLLANHFFFAQNN